MPPAAAKTVQVDEAEWNATRAVLSVVDKMTKNPKANQLILQARKAVEPNFVSDTEIAAAPYVEELTGLKKGFDELRGELTKEREDRAASERKRELGSMWEGGRKAAIARKYTKEGLEKLEQFMEKEGIIKHELAMPAFEEMYPAPPPAPTGISGAFDVFEPVSDDADDIKRLMESKGDDPHATNSLINKALADSRGVNRI